MQQPRAWGRGGCTASGRGGGRQPPALCSSICPRRGGLPGCLRFARGEGVTAGTRGRRERVTSGSSRGPWASGAAALTVHLASPLQTELLQNKEKSSPCSPSPASPPSEEAQGSSGALTAWDAKAGPKTTFRAQLRTRQRHGRAPGRPKRREASSCRAADQTKVPLQKGGRVHSMSCSARGHRGRTGPGQAGVRAGDHGSSIPGCFRAPFPQGWASSLAEVTPKSRLPQPLRPAGSGQGQSPNQSWLFSARRQPQRGEGAGWLPPCSPAYPQHLPGVTPTPPAPGSAPWQSSR